MENTSTQTFFQVLEQRWNQKKEQRKRPQDQNINLQVHRVQQDARLVDPIQKVRRKLITR